MGAAPPHVVSASARSYAAGMADKDYLGRSTGEGDSPDQQQAMQENRELAEQLGQPDQADRDDQQPVQQDNQQPVQQDDPDGDDGDD